MHPSKSYWVETNISTKTKSKKGHNSPKFCGWLLISNLTCILQWYIFCKLSIKSMHPCKSYWSETNINTPTKTKSKKGHNSAKIWWMITNIELDLYFLVISSSAKFEWNQCVPSKIIEQKRTTKTKSKKGHNSAKIWRMITNIELNLYFIMI